MKHKCTGYKDSKGNQYYLEDIVYNPFACDYWVVHNKPQDEDGVPYCLVLNNDFDQYYMDIDDPDGFIIVSHKGDNDYDDYLNKMKKTLRETELSYLIGSIIDFSKIATTKEKFLINNFLKSLTGKSLEEHTKEVEG